MRDDFIGIPDRIQTRPRGEGLASLDGVPAAAATTTTCRRHYRSFPLHRDDRRNAIIDAERRDGFPRPIAIRDVARDEYERDDRV